MIWFKAKEYGWGWYPVTWQGWVITLGFAGILAWRINRFMRFQESIVSSVAEITIIIGILILICYKKGEKPRWRWGE